MMGMVLPETCWACNKICNKYHLLHLVGILFPHNQVSCLKLNEHSVFCVARTKKYDVNDKLYVQAQEVQYAHERYLIGGEVMQTNESIWPHDMQTDRSRWPRGLRRGSAAALLLGSRVRILPGAGVYVSWECRVFSGRDLCVGLIPHTVESYRSFMC